MAKSSEVPKKLELPATPVQELIKSTLCNRVPDRYIFHPSNSSDSSSDDTNAYMNTPVINLHNLLLNPSSPEYQHELDNLRSVFCLWGCFQLINHGISTSEIEQIRALTTEFFALPLEEKQKYSRTLDWFEGYGGDTVTEGEPYSWNDRLHLTIHPVDQRNLKFWPQTPPHFRETLDEYAFGMKQLLEILLKAIAKSLEVEENSLLDQFGEDGMMYTRFNVYPPCPSPGQVFGLKPHSDGTLITILQQDEEVEGLQVMKDDKWFKVPIIPGALFVNAGDQLEIISNGMVKSVVHKVTIDKEKQRISIAVASGPSTHKEIGPIIGLINKVGAQLYQNVTNYRGLFYQHIARGERAINAVKM